MNPEEKQEQEITTNDNGDTPLHIAVRENNLDIDKSLMLLPAFKIQNNDNKTPLDLIFDEQSLLFAEYLATHNSKDYRSLLQNYIPNKKQWTPFHWAIKAKDLSLVKLFHEVYSGAFIQDETKNECDFVDEDGEYINDSLFLAVTVNSLPIVKYLVEELKYDISQSQAPAEYPCAFSLALLLQRKEIFDWMLNYIKELPTETSNNRQEFLYRIVWGLINRPIHPKKMEGFQEALDNPELLMKRNQLAIDLVNLPHFDVNQDLFNNPLIVEAAVLSHDFLLFMKKIIDLGADISELDKYIIDDMYIRINYREMFEDTKIYYVSLLEKLIAMYNNEESLSDNQQQQLSRLEDLKSRIEGDNALHYAAREGMKGFSHMEHSLMTLADFHTQNRDMKTPLDLIFDPHFRTSESDLLFSAFGMSWIHKWAVNDNGDTLLHVAVRENNLNIDMRLMHIEAFKVQNKDGKTPLDLIFDQKNLVFAKYLAEGKNPQPYQKLLKDYAPNETQGTPIDWAMASQNEELANLFKEVYSGKLNTAETISRLETNSAAPQQSVSSFSLGSPNNNSNPIPPFNAAVNAMGFAERMMFLIEQEEEDSLSKCNSFQPGNTH